MRGDSQVELRGAVLVGRRVVPETGSETDNGKLVTVKGLLLRIDSRGLTVEGPRPNVVHTVSWQRVRSIEAGNSAMFEDARPARSIQVELDDRRVQFLVPVEALGDHQMSALDAIVAAHVASRPHEQRDVFNETLGAISQTGPSATAIPGEPVAAGAVDPGLSEQSRKPSDVRAPMKAPKQRAPGAGDQSRPRGGSGLPPPPPASGVVMPPEPQMAAGSGVPRPKEDAVVGPPRALQQTPPIDRELLQPRAVPSARRVSAPISAASEPSLPEPDSRRVPPRLPPPPPGGSRSMPPAPVAEQSRIDPTPAVEQGQRAEVVPRAPRAPRPGPQVSAGVEGLRGSEAGVTDRRGAGDTDRRGERSERRRKNRTRSRRTMFIGGVLLVAAAAVGGSLFGLVVTDNASPPAPSSLGSPGVATRSASGGSPGGTTSGPSGDLDLNAIAGGLNIVAAGLPSGWESGKAPWPRVATAQSDAALAGCLGIPATHAGIVSGITEKGGPRVESSGWFASPSGESAFESHVDLTTAASTEESDIAALKGSRAASCLQGWFASLDRSGDQIVGAPSVSAVPVSVVAGEQAVRFRAVVVTRLRGAEVHVNEQLVFLGAGGVEVALVSESTGPQVAPSVESSQLNGLEHRLRSVTAS